MGVSGCGSVLWSGGRVLDENGGDVAGDVSTEWTAADGLVTGALSSEDALHGGDWAGGLTGERLERKFQAAWQLFQSVESQVQVADRKVQAIFAANTLLVAAVSFQNQGIVPSAHAQSLSLSAAVGLAARLFLLACICASYLSAIVALFPRLRHVKTRTHSLLFFGDIAALPGPEFAETFLAMTTAEKVRQVLRQTHEVSRVVAEKYKWTRRSGAALVLSLLLWIMVQAVSLLAGA